MSTHDAPVGPWLSVRLCGIKENNNEAEQSALTCSTCIVKSFMVKQRDVEHRVCRSEFSVMVYCFYIRLFLRFPFSSVCLITDHLESHELFYI